MTQFLFLRGPNQGNLVTIEYMPLAKHIGGTGSRQGSWLESASQPGKVEVAWLCPHCFYYKSDRVGLTECLVVDNFCRPRPGLPNGSDTTCSLQQATRRPQF